MSELEQNRYDQLIRRVGGIVQTGSMVSEVISDLLPVIDVERVPGELLLLGGTRLCFGSTNLAGAAGESARVQLFNPADSGTIITVTGIIFGSSTGQTIRIGRNATALASGVGTETFRDTRLAILNRPTGQIRQESLAALVDINIHYQVVSGVTIQLTQNNDIAVLGPGQGLDTGTQTNATVIRVTYLWRERAAEQSELQF